MRAAALSVHRSTVREAVLGNETSFAAGVLSVDAAELRTRALMAGGDAVADVIIEIARPGENTRIVHVLDALPALARQDGPAFDGFLAPPRPNVSGAVHTFDNLAILTCSELPWGAGGLLIAREAVIDMSGPLASLSPFGSTINVVLRISLSPDQAEVEYDAAIRRAGMAVADALGRIAAAAGGKPLPLGEVARSAGEGALAADEPSPLDEASPRGRGSLPRIVYINQIHSQGIYARTFLYGKELDGLVPTTLHPNEMLSGALVSGNYVYAAFKTPTWLHVKNPVLLGLARGHGREHAFAGVVLSRGHHYSAWEKERSANLAAHQAWLLRADGVALTWEGGGNSITDAMLTIRACERLGIKTAAVAYEMGDEDAADVILLDSVHEADALVSTGSTQRTFSMPRMDRILGGEALRMRPETGGEYVSAAGPLELDNPYILFCAAGQTGFGTLAGVAY